MGVMVLFRAQSVALNALDGRREDRVAAGAHVGRGRPYDDIGLLLFDHVTHHRAQAIMYLRMRGIEPPAYVGW